MATRRLVGPGRLPSPSNLKQFSPEQLVGVLNRFGMAPDLIALNAAATKAFERLDGLIDSGVEPSEEMWEVINKELKQAVGSYMRQQVKSAIKGYRLMRLQEEYGEGGKFAWVSVGDEGTCPSCEERHGQVKTLRQWKRVGLPGSAALQCRKECRCGIHPNEA